MDVNEFVISDRDIATLYGSTPDTLTRLSLVRESINVAESVALQSGSVDELADVALRCAASHVLLNELLGGDVQAAEGAATWAARAAAAVAGRDAAEVGCLPQAAAVVASVAKDLPPSIHHQAIMRMHAWLARLGSALEAVEASREQAEIAWRVALAAQSVAGLEEMASMARSASADAFRDAGDNELAALMEKR
jgi:hypothetical protein